MEEKQYKTKSDQQIREEYLNRLNKDIESSEIRKDNLDSQIHSLQIKLDGERKLVEQEKILKFSDEKQKLSKTENEQYSKGQQLDLREVHIKDREKAIDVKELNYSKFLEEKKVFNNDKLLFQEYKTKIEKELKEAQGRIADINSRFDSIDSEKQVLIAREKVVQDREDDLDTQAGILEKKKKDFELYKQSEIERYTNKEVVNV